MKTMESMKVRSIKQKEAEEEARMISYRLSVSKVVDGNLLVSARDSLKRLHVRLTLGNLGILAVVLSLLIPRCLTHLLVYPLFRLVFGTLYPAYASYKAVRTKNVKEYVKWMMYWIVFALFTCAETFTDVFLSFWFPFYYEIKIILVLWLLSPATKGSSILYRRFVHPALSRREAEIDEALARATEQGYTTVLHLGTRGVNYATTVLMQTAIKGGGGLVQQLKKSYSLSDLTGEKEDENRNTSDTRDEIDMEVEPRRREHVGRRGYSPRRTQSSSNRVEMYFSEVDVDVRQPRAREPLPSLSNIRSSEDISSGYSSGEALHPARAGSQVEPLVRTTSVGARTRPKPRSTVKKTPEHDEEDSMAEEQPDSRNVPLSMLPCFLDQDRLIQLLLALSGFDPRNRATSHENERDERLRAMFSDYFVDERDDPSTSKESSPEFLDSLSDADDYMKVGQVGVRIEEVDEDETGRIVFNSQICRVTSESFSNHIVDADSSLTNACSAATPYDHAAVTENSVSVDPIRRNTENYTHKGNSGPDNIATSMNESPKIDVAKITNEICQNKFEELKELINNARKTMSAIRGDDPIDASHENPRFPNVESSKEGRESNFDAKHKLETKPRSSKDDDIRNTTLNNSLEILRVPSSISRSNSDSSGRAGKYHKKPAPKAPASKSEEELGESSSQKAVRATLVIKTGTLRSGGSDDTFAPRSPKSSRRNKKSPKKEGFSKLLTIPKNIFHTAFHNKDDNEKIRSRSASFTSGDEDIRDNLCSGNDDDTLSEDLHKTVYEKEEFEEMHRRDGGIGNRARKDVYIREMSRSPTRRSPRLSSNTD